MTRIEDCVTLAEAARQLQMAIGYLRKSKVRARHGLQMVHHPLCLDERIIFLDRESVEHAAKALDSTRQLRARAKKLEPVATGSNFSNSK